MSQYYDHLETRSQDQRETETLAALREQLDGAIKKAPQIAAIMGDVSSSDLKAYSDLTKLPVTKKSSLVELQSEDPPFGGLNTVGPEGMANIFRSPGPIWDAGGAGDYWKVARTLFAAGIRKNDKLLNSFSYHMVPAGKMFESGAWTLGASVFPAGVGQTDLQVEAVEQLGLSAYAGTPDYLQTILDKAKELGKDVTSLRRAVVGGGALFPAMRSAYADQGIEVLQGYGTADLGIVAYEAINPNGGLPEGMILNEGMIVELLDPVSGEPVEAGEVGEVTVTNLNPDYPLIRFATGDLSALLPGQSPCGRTNQRIKGWMGRADMITKVKGMFVHPSQINKALAAFPDVSKSSLVVTNDGKRDSMTLNVVAGASLDEATRSAIANALRDTTKVAGEVTQVATLDDGAPAIDDQRKYDE